MIDNSPRHNAAFHVLHRLSMPRHPPCALTTHNKINTKEKITAHTTHTKHASCAQMLASTIQFSHTTPTTTNTPAKTSKLVQWWSTNNTHVLPETPNNAPTHNNYSLIKNAYSTKCSHDARNTNNKNAATHINNQRLCEQKLQHKHQPPTTVE